jgi:PAS domain S-box-containing protein
MDQAYLSTGITESKWYTENLEHHGVLFEAIFNDVPEAMILADHERRIFLCNPGFTNTFGYKPEEVVGKKTVVLYESEEEYAQQGRIRFNLSAEEKLKPYLVNYKRKDGTIFPGETIGTIILDPNGKPLGFLGLMRDITWRKKIEKERFELEKQLQHTQKLESLGVLTGGIAHDFNNILMAIKGNTELALATIKPGSPEYENISNIEKGVNQATDLVNQMLSYSGKGKFVTQSIHLNVLVKEMSQLLKISISKKVSILHHFTDNLPYFTGDTSQIRQIIMNLITNANEAIGSAEGEIKISTGMVNCNRLFLAEVIDKLGVLIEKPFPTGLYVYLEVNDTGCGMDDDTLARIFDPFFTTKFTGRGLGMAAVQGIIKSHGGFYQVKSIEGKGTHFKIYFPALAKQKQEETKNIQTPVSKKNLSGTILIADDEDSVRDVATQIVKFFGFEVLLAKDGREAVEIVQQQRDQIVCVLMDLTMPKLDGEQAFHEMRRIAPNINVILCSGYAGNETFEHLTQKGLAGFLNKPYSVTALRETLNRILG